MCTEQITGAAVRSCYTALLQSAHVRNGSGGSKAADRSVQVRSSVNVRSSLRAKQVFALQLTSAEELLKTDSSLCGFITGLH